MNSGLKCCPKKPEYDSRVPVQTSYGTCSCNKAAGGRRLGLKLLIHLTDAMPKPCGGLA